MTRKDTRTHFVTALCAELHKVNPLHKTKIDKILAEAEAGDYHDYKSKYTLPKVRLVMHLEEVELNDLADRVRDGDFDEEPDEEDKKKLLREAEKWLK